MPLRLPAVTRLLEADENVLPLPEAGFLVPVLLELKDDDLRATEELLPIPTLLPEGTLCPDELLTADEPLWFVREPEKPVELLCPKYTFLLFVTCMCPELPQCPKPPYQPQ